MPYLTVSQNKIKKMETSTLIFKSKKSLTYKIASSLFLIWGILWIQHFLFGGIVLSFGSIVFLATNEGLELDFVGRKF